MQTTQKQKEALNKYYQTHKEELKIKKAKYYQEHKEHWKEYGIKNKDRLLVWAKQNNRKLRLEAINEYGGKCECCGENRYEFLAFDHKDNTGHQQRKELGSQSTSIYKWLRKNNYPKGVIRILCHNCNLSIGFYKYCPHNKDFK